MFVDFSKLTIKSLGGELPVVFLINKFSKNPYLQQVTLASELRFGGLLKC